MADQGDPLARIADALERIAPAPSDTNWLAHPAYAWDGASGRPIAMIDAPGFDQLRGIDRQKAAVAETIARHAKGAAAHDMLLWGARGMGKSALVRAATVEKQAEGLPLALVQVPVDRLDTLPALFAQIANLDRRFLILVDDLGFGADESAALRRLRSFLEGGIEPRPDNVRLAVTANRRALVERADTADAMHESDELDDAMALADRFGLAIGFHTASQDDYLAMVDSYAAPLGLQYAPEDALTWARQRGARSGRTARQFVTELAGRAGKSL
ncbi:ATP-binding protein [Erythrobacter litoralis]|uniref:Predicted ATPase n=1 Tax=Erythrobacter litoralis (strain HTCC2594) TaxID=314225 RepID=Q2N6I1_ERYLH|nr:ATP-binding protein [Erythrobacter litoralis]ABC64710.1 predicted ATPase [Erythrobacter litoralis HTCC2594]